LLLSLVPGSYSVPLSNHPHALKKTTPHIDRLYQHLIPDEILYHNPSTTPRIVIIFSHVSSAFWLTSCFRFSRVGLSVVRVGSVYSGISSILTQIIVLFDGPLVAFCGSLYLFCSTWCLRKGLLNIMGRAATVLALFSRRFIILSFLIVKTHLNLIFLGSNSSIYFLGFMGSFFVCFFFRLISGEAGFNSLYGQFVQDNLTFPTVGYIECV